MLLAPNELHSALSSLKWRLFCFFSSTTHECDVCDVIDLNVIIHLGLGQPRGSNDATAGSIGYPIPDPGGHRGLHPTITTG